MKKIYFCAMLLFAIQFSIAQKTNSCRECCCDEDTTIACYSGSPEPVKTILYDFKSKNTAFPKGYYALKRGDAIRVKVVNYNPFVYKINIENRDSTHNPVVDNNNFLATLMNYSNLSGIVANLAGIINTPGATNTKTKEPTVEIVNMLAPDTHHAKQKSNVVPEKNPRQRLLDSIFAKNQKKIEKINDNLINEKEIINKKVYDWSRILIAERNPYPNCSDFTLLDNGIIKIETDFNTIRNTIKSTIKEVLNDQQHYLDSTIKYVDLIRAKDNEVAKATDSLIKTYYTSVIINLAKMDSSLSYKNIQPVIESLDKVKGIRPCYTSPPLYLTGDSKIITLQIKPWKDTLPYITDPPIVFELPWTQNRIWGISGGIYTGTLHNNNYTNKPGIDTAHYTLVSDNGSRLEFGINALAYTGWRINKEDKNSYNYIGVSFGAGMSIEAKPKPRVLLGASYLTGNNNRLIISASIIGGNVDRLSAAYTTDAIYTKPQSGYLKSVFTAGFAISVNYSFLGK